MGLCLEKVCCKQQPRTDVLKSQQDDVQGLINKLVPLSSLKTYHEILKVDTSKLLNMFPSDLLP